MKFELAQSQNLKLYLFIDKMILNTGQVKQHLTFAYTLEEALENIKILSKISNPFDGLFYCGAIDAKQLIAKINNEEQPLEVKKETERIKTVEAFLQNLQYATDEFVKDEKIIKQLKKIIKLIEKDYVNEVQHEGGITLQSSDGDGIAYSSGDSETKTRRSS